MDGLGQYRDQMWQQYGNVPKSHDLTGLLR